MQSPKRLSIKQAAPLLQMTEQGVREQIKAGNIGSWYGSKHHRTYYITDEQIRNFMKGGNQIEFR